MSSSSSSATDVFENGKYETIPKNVDSTGGNPDGLPVLPPEPLLIVSPMEEGEFPVLILLHGYMLLNSFYSELLQHIASHCFIVVAPQLYTCRGKDCTEDIRSAGAVTDWLRGGLSAALPSQVTPNLAKLALSGHSRGGKTAFALALGMLSITTSIPFRALIGIDPVDGSEGSQTPPPVLTYKTQSFDLEMPVMVIGAGLSEVKKCCMVPPCAANGVNHKEFFNECKPPACHFVAKDYGHMDMLDDKTPGLRGILADCICKNGKSREPMRKFVGGIVVASLRAYLGGDSTDLITVRDTPEIAPVELSAIEFLS
ncbi:chlorophyllase-2, chloroplastic-like [Punica granatum]|uniref:chlorophyllase n=1 Tax=Punica granatum TaxID=22663 RepID=A0A6P8C8G4_PUNGR|nr:chlorophyllase-2, chloroplastic-like [Punica granatum]